MRPEQITPREVEMMLWHIASQDEPSIAEFNGDTMRAVLLALQKDRADRDALRAELDRTKGEMERVRHANRVLDAVAFEAMTWRYEVELLTAELQRTKRNHLRRMEEASRRAQEKTNKRLNERLTAWGIPLYSATADKQRERLDKYWRLRQRIRAALERKADA